MDLFLFFCSGCNTHQLLSPLPACISSTGGEDRPLRQKQCRRLNQQLNRISAGMKLRTEQPGVPSPLTGAKSWLSTTPMPEERPSGPTNSFQIRKLATNLSETVQADTQCPLAELPLTKLFLRRTPAPAA